VRFAEWARSAEEHFTEFDNYFTDKMGSDGEKTLCDCRCESINGSCDIPLSLSHIALKQIWNDCLGKVRTGGSLVLEVENLNHLPEGPRLVKCHSKRLRTALCRRFVLQ